MTEKVEAGRLDKWVATQGRLSRKQIKELVRAGGVTVNGSPVKSAEQRVCEGDTVMIGGREITLQRHVYIMMNKPAGVVSATGDSRDKTVLDLVPESLWRPGLFPAGRLDKDTEGFLLLTDDGDFAHSILSPGRHVPKTYFARLSGPIVGNKIAEAFAEGIPLGGGDSCSPAELKVLKSDGEAEVELTIFEGMYHQVKRMFSQFRMDVLYLKRIRIGGLDLDPKLALGESRVILYNEQKLIC